MLQGDANFGMLVVCFVAAYPKKERYFIHN